MHSPALKTKPFKATDYKIKRTIPVQIRKHKLSGQWKRPGSNPLPGRKIIFTLSFQIPSKEPFTRKGATTNFSVAHRRQRTHCMLLRVILRLEFHTTATKQYTHNRVVVRSLLSFWCDQAGNELVT